MKGLVVAVLVSVVGCSSVEPHGTVTLRVERDGCFSDSCMPFDVIAFPKAQPSTPGGGWGFVLGTLSGPSGCFIFPPAKAFTVSTIGVADAVVEVDTAARWFVGDPLTVGFSPAAGVGRGARPVSAEFTPGKASGWRISLPSGTGLVQDAPCTP